jgi:hypothetical protein
MNERLIDALGVIFGLPALIVAITGIPFGLARCWDWVAGGHRRRPLRLWHLALAIGAAGLLMGMARPGGKPLAVVVAIIILTAFARSWRHEVAILMGLGDSDLPDRSVRVLWLILLVGLAPIGLWLFQYYRASRWPEADGRVDRAAGSERPGALPV